MCVHPTTFSSTGKCLPIRETAWKPKQLQSKKERVLPHAAWTQEGKSRGSHWASIGISRCRRKLWGQHRLLISLLCSISLFFFPQAMFDIFSLICKTAWSIKGHITRCCLDVVYLLCLFWLLCFGVTVESIPTSWTTNSTYNGVMDVVASWPESWN